MNIADSMKNVLRTKSQIIFNDIWRDDLKNILMDISDDISHMIKSGASSFKNLKRNKFRFNFKEMVDSGTDALLIFKVLPGRVKDGFMHFKDDLQHELEKLEDSKHKTFFCLKVFGALSSFTIGTIYGFKRGTADFTIKGLKRKNAFTQFIVAEIVFKISQLFIQRFLDEVEKEVNDPDELKNLRYFKELISSRSKLENHKNSEPDELPGDPAIIIVENLKTYIMTGKRT